MYQYPYITVHNMDILNKEKNLKNFKKEPFAAANKSIYIYRTLKSM